MSKYSAFYGRHGNSETKAEALDDSSKRQAYNLIMNSPTRRTVELMQLEEQPDEIFGLVSVESKYSIVSDKETFKKRIMLWRPDEGVSLGSYLRYDGRIYLATDVSDIDIYPQAFVDHCNYEFLIKNEPVRTRVGTDERGRPVYEYTESKYTIPCVITSKIYSTLNNSPVPLPVGAIMVYIPYHEKINVPVNHEFEVYGDKYKVTTVSTADLIRDRNGKVHGVLEIRGQREVDSPK